ncbi:hypothetical protein [Crocosphaera sp. XPORK-15E]|uniref:hypothetical protein n=1 Tax=Crocosphaera sp. XPORK-15E TaxID=3110247 RepID=UPI002B20AA7B|nr:hypothetical protein [Crocosphaera sp. XPORK-15E]MEA5535978.1 hypothetical protein [Crocosphaera sp. XPORK-15E]
MEDWQKELVEWLGTVTVAVEEFVDEVGQVVETASEEFQTDLVREIDQFFEDVFSPIIDISIEEDINISYYFNEDPDLMLSPKIEPTFNVHPACRGCHHYHGRVYGKHLLVCGMHPSGSHTSQCPDWEGTNNISQINDNN